MLLGGFFKNIKPKPTMIRGMMSNTGIMKYPKAMIKL